MVETTTLQGFIEDVQGVFQATNNPLEQGKQVAGLTAELMQKSDWLEIELEAIGGERISRGSVYVDEEYGHPEPGFRFTSGRDPAGENLGSNVAHDHGMAWVVYGTYSGQREQTLYEWVYDDAGIPELEQGGQFVQRKGDVILVPPGQIHQQRTIGTEESINFRVESQSMAGKPRHWYNVTEDKAEASIEPTVA